MQVSSEITNKWNTTGSQPVSIFLSTSIRLLSCPLPQKLFLVSHAYEAHNRNVCYTPLGKAKWLAYVLKKTVTTDQSWGLPGAGILQWGIENNACRLHYTVSPQLPHGFVQRLPFFIYFLHYLGAWKRLDGEYKSILNSWQKNYDALHLFQLLCMTKEKCTSKYWQCHNTFLLNETRFYD